MKLYSYYVDCPGLNAENELRLAILWRRTWAERGVETIVLNEWHARKHPLYEKLNGVVSKFPTSNPAAYERACYLRWLALASVGGGFMADLDLMPGHGAFEALVDLRLTVVPEVVIYQNSCPSLAHATPKGVELLTEAFMTSGQRPHGDKGHFSDMYAIEDTEAPWLSKQSWVKLYSEPGWEQAKFIHFANAVTASARKPRHELIPIVLPKNPAASAITLLVQ